MGVDGFIFILGTSSSVCDLFSPPIAFLGAYLFRFTLFRWLGIVIWKVRTHMVIQAGCVYASTMASVAGICDVRINNNKSIY